MSFVRYLAIVSTFVLIPATRADIRDFIIENANDLKRFGIDDMADQLYEDDLDVDWMPDSCGGGGGGVFAGGAYNPFDDYVDNDIHGLEYDASQIDPRLLKQILAQMKNDPRFEHLWEQLSEDNILVNHKMPGDGLEVEDASNYYLDMKTDYQEDGSYDIE